MSNSKYNESQELTLPKLGIISHNQLMKELDCSRFFIRTLVIEGKLKKLYIKEKVYFLVTEVMNLVREDKLTA